MYIWKSVSVKHVAGAAFYAVKNPPHKGSIFRVAGAALKKQSRCALLFCNLRPRHYSLSCRSLKQMDQLKKLGFKNGTSSIKLREK